MNSPQQLIAHANQSSEALAVADQLAISHAAALAAQEIDGHHFVLVPPSFVHKDITDLVERAQLAPARKRGSVALNDVASLIAYAKDQGSATSAYVYADADARTIAIVFNDHRGAAAGWRDHRATFKAEYTPEFARWLANNGSGRAKAQTDFAEFVEDNIADIAEPFARQLLDVATTIQATTGIEFKSSKRLQDGQTQLTYNEVVDARAGADGALTIPKEFHLGLRIFKNGEGYKLTARLKYRIGGGGVKFWYELDRPERAIEDAFEGYVKQLREGTDYAVVLGQPG